MSVPFTDNFEKYNRTTIPQSLASNPEGLYDLCTYVSVRSLDLAAHYSGKRLSAVAPVWDDGNQSPLQNPMLKLISAGNFKPVLEKSEDDIYTRVCAEQNLIDNALKVGDVLDGVLFIRSEKPLEPYEGTKEIEFPHMCSPCRGRALPIFGGNLVVVSFVGDGEQEDEPVEATTLRQQIEHHDFDNDLEVIARGKKDVKEFVVEEVFRKRNHAKKIETIPFIPSRRYQK